jgi:hypothetical protein
MFYNDFDNPENNSIIDLEKYKEICKVCDEILLSPDANEVTVAIPILHVIREHPVFLKQYESIFDTSSVKKNKIKLGGSIIIAIKLFFSLFFKSFSINKYWYSTKKLNTNYDYIFVSHLLNENQAGESKDFYFGDLPTSLSEQGKTVLIVLLNHSPVSNSLLSKKWKQNDVTRVLLSSKIGLFNEIKGALKILFEFKRLNKKSKNEISILKHKILKLATTQFTQTLNNYRKSKQFLNLAKIANPKIIITTFEGHAWERIIFSSVRNIIPDIKCVGYQHALIFKEQYAIRRNLQKKYNPDLILTSGHLGKNQLEKSSQLSNIDIKILGTNRVPIKNAISDNLSDIDNSNRKTILVVPEAIFSECILLFEYSISCANLYPNINFIWRLHPLLNFDQIILENKSLSIRPKNITLSKQTLEEDIVISNLVLYRGSTAVINCIMLGLKPIYLKIENEMTIDPLYEIDNFKYIVKTPNDLFEYLNKINNTRQNQEMERQHLLNYCYKIMSPFDIDTLI